MPRQTQETRNWFAGYSSSGFLPPWGAPQISHWERCNRREHSEAKLILWAGEWTHTIFRFSLQRFLSARNICGWCCWQELKVLKYCNFSQWKWRVAPAKSLPQDLQKCAIARFYFLIAELQCWWCPGLKYGKSFWLQEGGQSCISIKWILGAMSSIFRLEFINRMG